MICLIDVATTIHTPELVAMLPSQIQVDVLLDGPPALEGPVGRLLPRNTVLPVPTLEQSRRWLSKGCLLPQRSEYVSIRRISRGLFCAPGCGLRHDWLGEARRRHCSRCRICTECVEHLLVRHRAARERDWVNLPRIFEIDESNSQSGST